MKCIKFPILFIIGTIHGTDTEQKLFKTLNKLNVDWLCEGESDFRKCESLKNPLVHLISDTLFIYMILNDIDKVERPHKWSPELVNELIDRLIELLITITRQSDHLVFKKLFESIQTLNYNWINFLNMLNGDSIKQSTLFSISNKLRLIDLNQLFRYTDELINTLILIILKNKRINQDIDLEHICQFIINKGNCQTCEDYIFMKIRDKSFYEIILDHQIKTVTLVTVGIDHVSTLFKKFEKNRTFNVIPFECINNSDINKLLNNLVYIINYNK